MVKVTRRGRLRVRNGRDTIPTANDLVYLSQSPDYCQANATIGTLGKQISRNENAVLAVPTRVRSLSNLEQIYGQRAATWSFDREYAIFVLPRSLPLPILISHCSLIV